MPTPVLVALLGPGDGGFEPKIVFTGLSDRIERLRGLWACLTGVLRGWMDEEVKKDVKESDAADKRKIEPSSSLTGIGCGMLVKEGFGACTCAVDLRGDCNGSEGDVV